MWFAMQLLCVKHTVSTYAQTLVIELGTTVKNKGMEQDSSECPQDKSESQVVDAD